MGVSLTLFQKLVGSLALICAIYAAVRAQDHGPGQARSTLERMELKHLETVAAARKRFADERRLLPGRHGLKDLRAVFHVHAEDSPHTGGTLEEALEACRQTEVRVVFLTDHARKQLDPLRRSWQGLHNGVLFFPGAETEGLLSFPAAPTS